MLYFYLDNGSNVCGLEFNYKNGEEEGDSDLEEEKEDKKLEEGEGTKQDKMEGLEENEDNKSLLADKADDETFYNDQIFRQLFLGFEVESEEGRWFDPEFKDGEGVTGEEVAAELELEL